MARRIARRASPLHAFAPTHVLLALTSIELAYGSLRSPEAIVESVAAAIQAALKMTDAHILVTLPEPLADEIYDSGAAYAWRRAVTDGLRAALASAATLIDLEPLMRATGARPGPTIASTTPPSCPFIRTARRPCSAFWPMRSPA